VLVVPSVCLGQALALQHAVAAVKDVTGSLVKMSLHWWSHVAGVAEVVVGVLSVGLTL
jgi:hypothetical protein